MRRRLFRYGLGSVAAAITFGMVAWWAAPTAHADNCTGMYDCLPGISAFVCVAVALLIVIVLAIIFLPEVLFGAELLEEGSLLGAWGFADFSEGIGIGMETMGAPQEAAADAMMQVYNLMNSTDGATAAAELQSLAQQPGGQALINLAYNQASDLLAAIDSGEITSVSSTEVGILQSVQDFLRMFASAG